MENIYCDIAHQASTSPVFDTEAAGIVGYLVHILSSPLALL